MREKIARVTMAASKRMSVRLNLIVYIVLLSQSICTILFVGNIFSFNHGSPKIVWLVSEIITDIATLGLLLGISFGRIMLQRSNARAVWMEDRFRVATGEFMNLIGARFTEWNLTPAERDVALFAIKGLSIAEIASFRSTSEGTVKAQMAAIYCKAGVTGRTQLLSHFIEDLMNDPLQPSEPV